MIRRLMWILCVASLPALAADITTTWTQPTQNVDGSAIPATGTGRLTGNRVEWGTCTGTAPNYTFGTAAGQQSFAVPTAAYTVPNLAPGTHCFRAYASTTYGERGPSGVAAKVIAPPLPAPPTGLTVTQAVIAGMQQTPVYSVTASGSLSTLMGFADVGVACVGPVLATYRGAKFRQVARADVKMWGSTSLRLAAPCA